LQTIGTQLHQARTAQAIALDQVATYTRIQTRLLAAIEAGDLDRLPEPVYVRALIKQFGDAVGLDGAALARDFPTNTGAHIVQHSWRELPAAQLRPLHLYVLYVLLVAASILGLNAYLQRNPQQSADPAPIESAESPEPETSPVPPATDPPAPASEPTPTATEAVLPGRSVTVEIAIQRDSWLRVVTDGTETYEGILTAGEERTWTAEEQIVLRVGNAEGVVVAFNEQEPEPLGDSASPLTVTYEAERAPVRSSQ